MAITARFSELKLHTALLYQSEREAKQAAEWIRKQQPHETARTFKREVRAGGARVNVWVVVVRGKRTKEPKTNG